MARNYGLKSFRKVHSPILRQMAVRTSIDGKFHAINEAGTISRQKDNRLRYLDGCGCPGRRSLRSWLCKTLTHGIRAFGAGLLEALLHKRPIPVREFGFDRVAC